MEQLFRRSVFHLVSPKPMYEIAERREEFMGDVLSYTNAKEGKNPYFLMGVFTRCQI